MLICERDEYDLKLQRQVFTEEFMYCILKLVIIDLYSKLYMVTEAM